MPRPRLLFSTAAFFARPLGATFRLIAERGYAGVEVMVTKDPASQDPVVIRKLADEHGLEVGALHAPSLLLTRRIWGTDPIRKMERAAEVASDAGIPTVITHPPYRWQHAYRNRLHDVLPDIERRTGVVVGIENMFPLHVGSHPLMLHANQDLDELEGIRHLVLDTSHAAVAKHDLLEVRRRFGDRLRHVHLSDNAGHGWDSHLPPGEGVLPLGRFLDDLVASGYDKTISLEVDLRRYLTEQARLDPILESMRAWVESRLAEAPG